MKRLRLAALVLLARQAIATNGYFLEGYGTNSKAQAGVGIALPLDSLTVATNPAGLTVVADAVTFGVEIFRPQRNATLVQGGESEEFNGDDVKLFYLPEIGASGHINDRLAWGVALYGNGGLDTDYGSNPYARFGAQGVAGVDLEQAFLSPALAVTLNEAKPAFLYVRRRHADLLGKVTELPDRFKITGRLVGGSAIFGLGWGLSGICPGPGLLLLTGGSVQSIVFVGAVITGFFVEGLMPGGKSA